MNVTEEAVVEELSPYEELFATVVAATSNFVYSPAANLVTDEFNRQSDKFNCQSDEFNCQNL